MEDKIDTQVRQLDPRHAVEISRSHFLFLGIATARISKSATDSDNRTLHTFVDFRHSHM